MYLLLLQLRKWWKRFTEIRRRFLRGVALGIISKNRRNNEFFIPKPPKPTALSPNRSRRYIIMVVLHWFHRSIINDSHKVKSKCVFSKRQLNRYGVVAVAVLLILIIVVCCFPPKNDNPASLREQDSISVDSRPSSTEGLAIDINDARCLRIDVVEEEDVQYTTILPAQQGSRFKREIHYLNICDVCIDVNGEVARLDEALRNGLISLDEIIAYAQIDARNGFCQNYSKTRNGLNFLVYRYAEYDLRLSYNFSYTPDGKTHLVHELYVCRNDYELRGSAVTTVHEDWGLTFEVVEASADSITLNCTQSGGQQRGELIADFYYIDLACDYYTKFGIITVIPKNPLYQKCGKVL